MRRILLLTCLIHLSFFSIAQNEFVTVWKTDAIISPLASKANQIEIPAYGDNFNIYWESSNNPSINGQVIGSGKTLITFPEIGLYVVKISSGNGYFNGLVFNESFDSRKLMEIRKWGNFTISTLKKAYYECRDLKITATDLPDVSQVTDMSWAFYDCKSITTIPNMENWNTSKAQRMDLMFYGCTNFNQSLTNWNTSNVINMTSMFSGCENFNQILNNWNVSKVTNINSIFEGCTNFNQPLNNWNVSNVTIMGGAFSRAKNFNQPLNNWNVSGCINMFSVFNGCTNFNQPLNNWDVSKVESFQQMFENAMSFNQSLSNWQINKLANFKMAFNGSGLDSNNYSNTLIGWANNLSTPNNIPLDAIGKKYLQSAISAREKLISKGWTINDAGLFIIPFRLGSIDATKTNNSIMVGWNVEGDTPDRVYYLEVNENGGAWKRIGTLTSKSSVTPSITTYNYQFTLSENGSVTYASLFGNMVFILIVLSIIFVSKNRRFFTRSFCLLFLITIISCGKGDTIQNNPPSPPTTKNKVNIRVITKDKTGSELTSNVATIEGFDISKF